MERADHVRPGVVAQAGHPVFRVASENQTSPHRGGVHQGSLLRTYPLPVNKDSPLRQRLLGWLYRLLSLWNINTRFLSPLRQFFRVLSKELLRIINVNSYPLSKLSYLLLSKRI